MLSKSFRAHDGSFIGLANYARYFATPALSYSIGNSLHVALITTGITVPMAFVFAYALTRSCVPAKGLFKTIALVPILVPSLLPGIALVYLFGNQGLIKWAMFGHEIYGPIGIVIAEVFFTLPHALIIVLTALSVADARLYEAALSLRATKPRIFLSVTLPGVRYGLISAAFVVFTLAFTDFGAPKVIGGGYDVLATDVYKQVIGQQNFEMGAVVSVVLLIPAAFAFLVDRLIQKRQVALLSARAVPLTPLPSRRFDLLMLGYLLLVSLFILGILGTCQYAALVKFYPYNLELGLKNYRFDVMDGGGWSSYHNSIQLGLWTALFGTIDRLPRRLSGREGQRFPRRPHPLPTVRHVADGGPGPGARARLYFLLQRPTQSFERDLSHDADPGDRNHHPLLHGRPPDRGDRAQAARPASSRRSRPH